MRKPGKAATPRRGFRRGILGCLAIGVLLVASAVVTVSAFHDGAVATAEAGDASTAYRLHRDIQYSHASPDRVRNQLDVYQPRRGSGRMPVVIWVHGGGWYRGSKDASVAAKAQRFTRERNVFVSVNYRLSPDYRDGRGFRPGRVMFPDHPRDVAGAIAWVRRNISRFGGDPRRIVLIGHSAGAQIVSLLGTDPRYLQERGVNPSVIRGVISLDAYGLDMPALADPAIRLLSETHRGMYWNAFGAPWEPGSYRRWELASAINYADRRDPPFLFVVSSDSGWRIREVRAMARALGQDPDRASLPVRFDHRQINLLFGVRYDGSPQTARALAFTRAVTDPGLVPQVRLSGLRARYRANARTGLAAVTVAARSKPRGAPLTCRVDLRPARHCGGRQTYRLRPGTHVLTAAATDFAGRVRDRIAHRIVVERPRR